jgi:chemotaxis protein methyltransferase CheR
VSAALDEALVERAGQALRRAAGLSLSSGLAVALREALGAAAAERGVAPAALAEAVAGGDPVALQVLLEHAVVRETSFWRHPEAFAALRRLLLDRPGPLRLWSAGCASGEEPYSLALALLEAGREGRGDEILATDVSARALDAAREATYGRWALRRLPPGLAGWFAGEGDRARLDPRARAPVRFARHNLVQDPPPGTFDLVACRNVLIYFEPEVARAALGRLLEAVAPGGFLLLGPVELPLATGLAELEWVEAAGATLLRRPA